MFFLGGREHDLEARGGARRREEERGGHQPICEPSDAKSLREETAPTWEDRGESTRRSEEMKDKVEADRTLGLRGMTRTRNGL